ncbi:MAG: hypothetical protein JW395_1622 [Nitrospira sp.]|nr:hypothetical protein [Nitrospira sp.]
MKHLDVVEVGVQFVGSYLSKRRSVTLPTAAATSHDDNLPRGLNTYGATFVRAESGFFDKTTDPYTDVPTLCPKAALLTAELPIARRIDCPAKAFRVVAGVVNNCAGKHISESAVKGKLVRSNHIA